MLVLQPGVLFPQLPMFPLSPLQPLPLPPQGCLPLLQPGLLCHQMALPGGGEKGVRDLPRRLPH